MWFWFCQNFKLRIAYWLCCHQMVQISRITALKSIWEIGWYMGSWMHNGRNDRRLTSISGRKWNGLTICHLENHRSLNIIITGDILKKSSILGNEIPWDFKIGNDWKTLSEQNIVQRNGIFKIDTLDGSWLTSNCLRSTWASLSIWFMGERNRLQAFQLQKANKSGKRWI